MTSLIDVAARVIEALDESGVPYTVGGSLASSFSGEPRASIDADIVVDMTPDHIPGFLARLGSGFYADEDALRRAVAARSTTNLIHQATGTKVDLFVAGSRLERRQLDRRRRVQVSSDPDRSWYVHSPEDILLQKLVWYRAGGEVSDRQWRDVVAIVAVQGPRLDRRYLTASAPEFGVADLLHRLLA